MKLPCALTIAGSDSGGGAGIQADIKTFAALDVHGLCVMTAITAQNTLGVDATFELPPEFVIQQLDTLMKDFRVKFAKIGMLSNIGIIKAVDSSTKRHGLKLVVDPLMISATGSSLLREEALTALVGLLSRAELATPNLLEAEKLSGMRIRSKADMKRAARKIARLGPRSVLIKGGHLKGRVVTDVLYTNGKFTELSTPRITADSTHGTGCSYSSAITAELAKGENLQTAVTNAREFLLDAIRGRLSVGKGVMPVNQMYALLREANKCRAIEEVWKASQLLIGDPKFSMLLPEVGSNIAMALPDAKSTSDVVGLSGRMIMVGGKAIVTGFPELGGSEHVANIVLTAMGHDPRIRAAINIRYSQKILQACRGLGLDTSTFDRRAEPKGVKTMRWGVERAIEKTGKVPQVIFDKGGFGKEAMIRLLGETPSDVAELALRVAKKMDHGKAF